jgi:hypothetical protein
MSEVCKCGRARYTSSDLLRWQDEVDEFGKSGGNGVSFNPDWAKPICWTIAGASCNYKKLPKETK